MPKKPDEKPDEAKKFLDDLGEPYVLIRLPSKSIMKDEQPKNNDTRIDTNITVDAFKITIGNLWATLTGQVKPKR